MNRKVIYLVVSFAVLLIFVWVLFNSSTPKHEVRYTITPLESEGTVLINASDINNRGEVVGLTIAPEVSAVLWRRTAGIVKIATRLFDCRINDLGQVVGRKSVAVDGITESHAFFWAPGTGLKDLGLANNHYGQTFDLNNRGSVVRSERIRDATGNPHESAFIWNATSGSIPLQAMGGEILHAYDINDHGEVLCVFKDQNGKRKPGLWSETYGLRTITASNTNFIFTLWGLNDTGAAFGITGTKKNVDSACLWKDGEIFEIGTLGGMSSYPRDMNNRGHVVGSSTAWLPYMKDRIRETSRQSFKKLGMIGLTFHEMIYAKPPIAERTKAFLWEGGEIEDLNDLIPRGSGWNLETANAINNRGEIVGWGIYKGKFAAFLLTPIHESDDGN